MVPRVAVVLLLVVASLHAGCGSAAPGELPPAAEPASSPPPAAAPDGRLVPVGFKPEGVVADPRTGLVAVGLRSPDELALVNGSTGEIERRVPLPAAPRHLSSAGDGGGPVLVPAEDADALLEVALPSGALTRAPTGREPHDAAAAGGRVFVADELAHTLTVLADGRPVATVETALQPGGALLVYHLRPKLELIRRYPLPGSPYGIAIDNRRHRMYVTQTARNQLTELTVGGRPSLVRRYATPRQPNTVAVDDASGRVFVTGKVDGVLQLLDPERERAR